MEYFEDLYNVPADERVAVDMYGLDGDTRDHYFGWELVSRTEVENRVKMFKNSKTAGITNFKGEIEWGWISGWVDLKIVKYGFWEWCSARWLTYYCDCSIILK